MSRGTVQSAVTGAGPSATADTAVGLAGVTKPYAEVAAVAGVDLEIGRGEFFTMLGPSGSGKTTLLRLIAGFERADAGTVTMNGVDVTDRPPYERDVNTVFQDYALFPHMSVQDNVEYGLRVKGVDRSRRRAEAAQTLELVGLAGLGNRRPAQLSGGQRQRVALARAIVNSPAVLLLDEPLGALDLKLRQAMQVELKRIQREVGITFVYVTHDQEEALTMSDRIAVFNNGRIEQVGPPREVYDRPDTEFVAGFVGTSNVVVHDGRRYAVRPERVRLVDAAASLPAGWQSAAGRVTDVVFLGTLRRFTVDLDDGARMLAVTAGHDDAAAAGRGIDAPGARVQVAWSPAQAHELRTNDSEESR